MEKETVKRLAERVEALRVREQNVHDENRFLGLSSEDSAVARVLQKGKQRSKLVTACQRDAAEQQFKLKRQLLASGGSKTEPIGSSKMAFPSVFAKKLMEIPHFGQAFSSLAQRQQP